MGFFIILLVSLNLLNFGVSFWLVYKKKKAPMKIESKKSPDIYSVYDPNYDELPRKSQFYVGDNVRNKVRSFEAIGTVRSLKDIEENHEMRVSTILEEIYDEIELPGG
jgi:hypothetical protein